MAKRKGTLDESGAENASERISRPRPVGETFRGTLGAPQLAKNDLDALIRLAAQRGITVTEMAQELLEKAIRSAASTKEK